MKLNHTPPSTPAATSSATSSNDVPKSTVLHNNRFLENTRREVYRPASETRNDVDPAKASLHLQTLSNTLSLQGSSGRPRE